MCIKVDLKTFTLRLTPKQHEILERRAKESNLSKNQFIAELIEDSDEGQHIQKRIEELETEFEKLKNRLEKVELIPIMRIAKEEIMQK